MAVLDDLLRHNLEKLTSSEFWGVAMSESVGGNAQRGCLAVNLEVDAEGRIQYMGNDPDRTNVTIRMYLSWPRKSPEKLKEVIIEVHGVSDPVRKDLLQLSVWLWNVHQLDKERPLLDRFLSGRLAWAATREILASKYPQAPLGSLP